MEKKDEDENSLNKMYIHPASYNLMYIGKVESLLLLQNN